MRLKKIGSTLLNFQVTSLLLWRRFRGMLSVGTKASLAWIATTGVAGANANEGVRDGALLPHVATTAPTEPASLSQLLQVAGGLLLVVIFIFALAWLLRRAGMVSGVAGSVLRVLGVLSVGQREKLVLVQVGDKQLLVGVTPGSVTTLHVLETPIEVPVGKLAKHALSASGETEADGKLSGSFAARLEAALSQRIKK
jgi:flagellar biosynthetic protein FliO